MHCLLTIATQLYLVSSYFVKDASSFGWQAQHVTTFSTTSRLSSSSLRIVKLGGGEKSEEELVTVREELDDDKNKVDPVARASWFAVEAFGNVFGQMNKKETRAAEEPTTYYLDNPPQSMEETLQRIKDENEKSYFLSGEVDRLIYDEKCIFSDPFVSFEGRDRFVDNLSNLGSFITKYDARVLNYEVNETNNSVMTKFMVKLELNLPWSPVLAWPWGVLYKIDPETNLIVSHEESWDIEPLEGVKQIFRPATVSIKED